jgi:hypothetical protein
MRRAVLVFVAAIATLPLFAGSASAAFGLRSTNVEFHDETGAATSVAGSHPFDFSTEFSMNTVSDGTYELPEGELKGLEIAQIPGLVGSQNVPRCTSADFNHRPLMINPLNNEPERRPSCPDRTAVGYVAVKGEFEAFAVGFEDSVHAPLYNLEPAQGDAATLGFDVLNVPIVIDVNVSTSSPYNLVAHLRDSPQSIQIYSSTVTIWGNPASPSHDALRGNCLANPNSPTPEVVSLGSCSAEGTPETAFLTLPRSCAGPLNTVFVAEQWAAPGVMTEPRSPLTPFTATGCEALGFDPHISAGGTNAGAESPSGLDFDLSVEDPGLSNPAGHAQSDIEKAVVTLPAGFTTNPAVASGLGACTLAQYEAEALAYDPSSGCPGSSKVGTVEVESPLLQEKVDGEIFVAKQGDNVFHSLLALYMVLRNEKNGILIKQPMKIDPDPQTGQLTSTVGDIPQLPFSDFHLHFRDGARAPLITPPTCGAHEIVAQLYPRSNPAAPVTRTASLAVSSGAGGSACPASAQALSNSRGFAAGTVDPTAGKYSPFVLKVSRSDGSQQISSIETVLPQGLLGKLAGIPYCPESGIAQAQSRSAEGDGALEERSPSCPSTSQIGKVTVATGAGDEPLYVQGHAYLAGPYKGAPLSLEIITPAIAGPFDLGTVAVRTALQVNPVTTQITAVSDPIPTILHGLPLDVRSIAVELDRPDFTLNPTSCEPKAITGSTTSTIGQVATLSQYYQAANCARLAFKPKLALSLKGKTTRGKDPALKAVLTYPQGGPYANIARVSTILPRSEFIDNRHVNNPCTRVQFAAGACPPKSILGHAVAYSPLLDKPLEGPIYFRSNGGERELPDLVADLNGQIHVTLVGFIDSVHQKHSEISRTRTIFAGVPDAPVSRFVLQLQGNKKGLLQNSANLCKVSNKATVKMWAQNGRIEETHREIANGCGKAKHKKKHTKHKQDRRSKKSQAKAKQHH